MFDDPLGWDALARKVEAFTARLRGSGGGRSGPATDEHS
jgi:hypothetical protein